MGHIASAIASGAAGGLAYTTAVPTALPIASRTVRVKDPRKPRRGQYTREHLTHDRVGPMVSERGSLARPSRDKRKAGRVKERDLSLDRTQASPVESCAAKGEVGAASYPGSIARCAVPASVVARCPITPDDKRKT